MSNTLKVYKTPSIDEVFGKFRLEIVLKLEPTQTNSDQGIGIEMSIVLKVEPPKAPPPPGLEEIAGKLYDGFVRYYLPYIANDQGGERKITVLSYKESSDGKAIGQSCQPPHESVDGVDSRCIFWNFLDHIDKSTLRGFLKSISSGLTDEAFSSILELGKYHKSYRGIRDTLDEGSDVIIYRDAFGVKVLYVFDTDNVPESDDSHSLIYEIVDQPGGGDKEVERVIFYRGRFDDFSYDYGIFLVFDVSGGIRKALSESGGFEIEESVIYRKKADGEEKIPVSASSQEPELDMPLRKVRPFVRARLPISMEPKLAFFGYTRYLTTNSFYDDHLSGIKVDEREDILKFLYPKRVEGANTLNFVIREHNFFMIPRDDTEIEYGNTPNLERDYLGPKTEEGGLDDFLKALSKVERMESSLKTASCLMGRAISLLLPDMSPEEIAEAIKEARRRAVLQALTDYKVDFKPEINGFRPFTGVARVIEYLAKKREDYNLLARIVTSFQPDDEDDDEEPPKKADDKESIRLEVLFYPEESSERIEYTSLRVGDSIFDLVLIGRFTKRYVESPPIPLTRALGIGYTLLLKR